MQIPNKLVIAGAILGVVPIVLGIVAVSTQSWISTRIFNTTFTTGTFGLFQCASIRCSTRPGFSVTQALEIAGVAAIGVGVIIAVVLDILIKNRWVHLLPLVFLFGGPTLILIGLILYAKYLFEFLSSISGGIATILDIGYSIILIIIACLLGFLTAVYFAFVAGFGRHHVHVHHHNTHHHDAHHDRIVKSPIDAVVIQDSERF
jgi:hypothetical protein